MSGYPQFVVKVKDTGEVFQVSPVDMEPSETSALRELNRYLHAKSEMKNLEANDVEIVLFSQMYPSGVRLLF